MNVHELWLNRITYDIYSPYKPLLRSPGRLCEALGEEGGAGARHN